MSAFESKSRTHEIKDYDSYCILSITADHIAVEGNARIEILKKSTLTLETKLDIHQNFKSAIALGNHLYFACSKGSQTFIYKINSKNFNIVNSMRTEVCVRHMLPVDNEVLLLGQDYGCIDLVRVSDLKILSSE